MVKKYYVNMSGEYDGDIRQLIIDINNLELKKIKLIFTEIKDDEN